MTQKLLIDESTDSYLQIAQRDNNLILDRSCGKSQDRLVHHALAIFWRVYDMANSPLEPEKSAAIKVLSRDLRIRNIPGAENLFW